MTIEGTLKGFEIINGESLESEITRSGRHAAIFLISAFNCFEKLVNWYGRLAMLFLIEKAPSDVQESSKGGTASHLNPLCLRKSVASPNEEKDTSYPNSLTSSASINILLA